MPGALHAHGIPPLPLIAALPVAAQIYACRMPRYEQLIGRHERDRLIVALHAKGYSHEKIGRFVGLSRRGVGMALERIAAAGRPDPDAEWGPPRPADDDEWSTNGPLGRTVVDNLTCLKDEDDERDADDA